jgi:hypothetical protein
MDLPLYGRVIWRFRVIVAIGVLLAVGLAFLSFVRVSFADGLKISYRQSEDWSASTTYVLTGSGFPVGGVNSSLGPSSPLALSSLAALYAAYATSDEVMRRIKRAGPVDGVVTAESFVNQQTSQRSPLPLLAITADAATPAKAMRLAHRAARAFMSYVLDQQNAANIAPGKRVQFRVVNAPQGATLVGPRKKTLPIVIFLTLLTATLGLAFVLENLRPRVRPIDTLEDESRPTRRSA